ncbi:MAG: phytase [Gammaproteobacteria bacterium]|nr:phytase [Gammaproteobacteria bacterium]
MVLRLRFSPMVRLAVLLPWLGLFAVHAQAEVAEVHAELETRSQYDDDAGNNADADDPAIWIHPTKRSRSLVITTLKEGGIDVYDLSGRLLQHLDADSETEIAEPGRFNNADLIYGFPVGDESLDLVVVSDRGRDQLVIFRIRPNYNDRLLPLIEFTSRTQAGNIFTANQDEANDGRTAYGLATAKMSSTGPYYAFVSQNDTTQVARLELLASNDGRVGYRLDKTVALPDLYTLPNGNTWRACQDEDGQEAQVEGMVADVVHDRLYMGQEKVGIVRTSLSAFGNAYEFVDKTTDFGVPYQRIYDEEEEEYLCVLLSGPISGVSGEYLQADVEGLTLYAPPGGNGYLLASSQGDDTFVVYDRRPGNAFVGQFVIGADDDDGLDSVEETDGAMVTNVNLGGEFEDGLLVVQDGENTPEKKDADGETRDNTNFKFVEWEDVAEELDLLIDTRQAVRP